MTSASPYVMTPAETAVGYLFGHEPSLPPAEVTSRGPREALEAVLLTALRRAPCGVAFSGGQDSSLVLAVATHVARREGLPDPVPLTWLFPDAPATEETEWQELVVRHLGLEEWQRVILHAELDIIGPLAQRHLVEHGVIWPPTVHGDQPLLEFVRGGSLIDGEGGDEVLGVMAHRIAAVNTIVRSPRPFSRRRLRRVVRAVAPARLRARHRLAGLPATPWLRSAARAELEHHIARAEAQAPLSFASSVRMVPLRRSQQIGLRNRQFLARGHDVEVSTPLLDPEVVHALARHGKWLGAGQRSDVLRHLADDVLPEALITRSTKAAFAGAFQAATTRAFAESWNGEGVDPDVVVVDELRRMWQTGDPAAPTAALLQQAWLGSRTAMSPM